MEKVVNLTLEIEALESNTSEIANLSATVNMNKERHENIDFSFNVLCQNIDNVFDTSDAPGGDQYDCCRQEYTGTSGSIGQVMVCEKKSILDLSPNPPFSQTDRGTCDTSCGSDSEGLVSASSPLSFSPFRRAAIEESNTISRASRSSHTTFDKIMEKICNLTERLEVLKEVVANNTQLSEVNKKRHENTDLTFKKLCPMIDELFDTASPPNGNQLDCCHEDFSGTDGQVGQVMTCVEHDLLSTLELWGIAPFELTGQKECADTCGSITDNLRFLMEHPTQSIEEIQALLEYPTPSREKKSYKQSFSSYHNYGSSDGQKVLRELRDSGDSLTEVLEKLNNLTDRMDTIEATVESIAETAEMNQKRHENTDYSLGKLCPLIDTIFDTSDAPGEVQYDCCYESHSEGTKDVVGQAMFCTTQSALSTDPDPEYPTTDRGTCADTCGDIPPN